MYEAEKKETAGYWSIFRMPFRLKRILITTVLILSVFGLQMKPAHALSPKVKVIAITAGYRECRRGRVSHGGRQSGW